MSLPFVYHASYSQLALPSQHRFPSSKYRNLYLAALNHGWLSSAQHHKPEAIDPLILTQSHDISYIEQFLNGTLPDKFMRRIGFPWTEQLVTRTLHAVSGTTLTAQLALEYQRAIHLTGGYHHAHHDFGSGFCIFNDLVIAAKQALTQAEIDKVLIFDCDVHQADGTAAMCQDEPNIITCSVHCQKNFPSRKMHSDHDIALDKFCDDNHYLQTIAEVLPLLINLHRPDLIIYDAGVDIHQDDDLGYLNITTEGLLQRDTLVFKTAKQHGIPVASVIGGGYSRDPDSLTQRHGQLLIAANTIW
ncbi:histone deacetylase [Shewanella maritima]|uniref:histone deacetylase family protein n=1 Tax=Shewanella maritima TaxID=2520507 RepID=UPI00373688D5